MKNSMARPSNRYGVGTKYIELLPDYQKRMFCLSGPLRMVIALEEQLAVINIPQEQLSMITFPDYD